MSDIPDFKLPSGQVIKCGALLPDMTKVKAGITQYFEDLYPNLIMDDSDILKLIKNPNWVPARKRYDTHWVVKGNQGPFGSCNGWMTAMIASKLRWIRGIRDGKTQADQIVLSGNYIYSLLNGGRDNGSALQDDIGEMINNGAPSVDSCPANLIWRKDTEKFDAEAAKHKCSEGDWLPVKTIQGWKSAIAQGALGAMCVDVNNAFANYKGNGLTPTGNGVGNHAIHADDVEEYKGKVVVAPPNNWGLGWGDQGRGLLIPEEAGARTFGYHQWYVGFSTLEAS